MQAITLSVSIDRDWRDLYEAIWRPKAFPRWASSGLAQSTLELTGDVWKARGPAGEVTIRFTPHNAFGVMDHTVILEDGTEVDVPLRVIRNGDGPEVALTLFRQPGMSDEKFAADADWVRRDLATLAQRFAA
ncbi:polyketide cyclase [Candidatus Burkholderia verschuerenii]|nr:polyketide cyclase [Candidatus Burkholderia verschuerenii]